MDYFIAQMRLGQEQAITHYILNHLRALDLYNPMFVRSTKWSNRAKDSEQSAYLFPRYLFVSASLPWQEISRVPGVTLVLGKDGPVRVPMRFIEELRGPELKGVYKEEITRLPNHERARLLIWMFDKNWEDFLGWDAVIQAQGRKAA